MGYNESDQLFASPPSFVPPGSVAEVTDIYAAVAQLGALLLVRVRPAATLQRPRSNPPALRDIRWAMRPATKTLLNCSGPLYGNKHGCNSVRLRVLPYLALQHKNPSARVARFATRQGKIL